MREPSLNPIETHPHATASASPAPGRSRRRTRSFGFAVPVALLSLLTACGDSDTPAASGASSAAGSVLTASVGQGDAPVITLVDSAGAPVTTLKAGSYTVNVKDLSAKHNFHLLGTGVEQKTTVPETTDVTWTVTLAAGTYTFQCDPHKAKMVGTFTVT